MDPGSLLLIAITFGLLFMIFSRGRKQQREVQELQARLAPGAEVMTTSGMYGTLVELTDDGVAVLETAPGQHTRWDRRAIAKIVTADTGVESPEPGATAVEPLAPGRPADSTAPSDRD